QRAAAAVLVDGLAAPNGERERCAAAGAWRQSCRCRAEERVRSAVFVDAPDPSRAMAVFKRAALAGTREVVPLLGMPLAHPADVAVMVDERPVAIGTAQIRRRQRRRRRGTAPMDTTQDWALCR